MVSYKKKKRNPVGCIMVFLFIFLGAAIALLWYVKYSPSKEQVDLKKLFSVNGDQSAIVLDYELLEEEQAIVENGIFYVSISFILNELNDRFFWDFVEERLLYTFPDDIMEFAKDEYLIIDEEPWLPMELVAEHTNIRYQAYEGVVDGTDVNRIFIHREWNSEKKGFVKKDTQIRVLGGVKSPVITPILKGDTVILLEQLDKWSKVYSENGYIGYIQTSKVERIHEDDSVSTFEEPVFSSEQRTDEVFLVWHQVFSKEGNKGLENLLQGTEGINVVSPTWFSLTDNEGGFTSLADKDYVTKAHQQGLEVWGLIDNFSKDVNSYKLLTPTTTRRRLIQNLIDTALEYGLDGINLDFESLNSEAGLAYVQFIREMSIACRENGLVLSVDNHVPKPFNSFYNLKEQGLFADYIIVMVYDEHYSGSEPGSTASLDFTKEALEESLKLVPAEKLVHAMPFYTQLWMTNDEKTELKAMGMTTSKNNLLSRDIEPIWLEDIGQYYGEYYEDGKFHQVWVEDTTSLELRLKLYSEYNLAGVAFWKLGLESSDVWEVINQYVNP